MLLKYCKKSNKRLKLNKRLNNRGIMSKLNNLLKTVISLSMIFHVYSEVIKERTRFRACVEFSKHINNTDSGT